MNENEQFFIAEVARHARSLPLNKCAKFLSGLLTALPESHPAAENLRSIYRTLTDSDLQLDMVQIGRSESSKPDLFSHVADIETALEGKPPRALILAVHRLERRAIRAVHRARRSGS
jgi:hypothetical protein